MGFLRMQQKNFGGAISYLTQAEQNGYKAKTVEAALATSRFWFTMGEATQAFDQNQFDVAATKFRAALDMKPRSPEALNGLAGLLHQAAAILHRRRRLRAAHPRAARLARWLARTVPRLRARRSERKGSCRLGALSRAGQGRAQQRS